ncbi:MAG: DMT family transporter [Candidatus Uhrbacteria bacterium]
MPFWVIIVLGAHILNALSFLVNKFLLARAVSRPGAYAFYVGALGLIAFALLPFDPALPSSAAAWAIDVAAGATFVLALLAFFTALKRGEASRIIPYVGGTIPVWTLILAYLWLGERLASRELIAFAILVIGSALVAREMKEGRTRTRGAYMYASLAALAFGVSSVLMKAAFLSQPFIAAFVWSRAGAVIAALAILFHGVSRRAIFAREERPRGRRVLTLFFSGQIAGALGFLMLQYAISVASPTLVNALQGVQYAFLFLLIVILGRRYKQLHENLSRAIVIQKLTAIAVIVIGLATLASG